MQMQVVYDYCSVQCPNNIIRSICAKCCSRSVRLNEKGEQRERERLVRCTECERGRRREKDLISHYIGCEVSDLNYERTSHERTSLFAQQNISYNS